MLFNNNKGEWFQFVGVVFLKKYGKTVIVIFKDSK